MSNSKEADLAAIKAAFEFNEALIASKPQIANHPLVVAALARSKACYAAFLAALADIEAERNFFRIGKTHRHFRHTCTAADQAHAALRYAIEMAEEEAEKRKAGQPTTDQANKSNFNQCRRELEEAILGETLSFAASVATKLDALINSYIEWRRNSFDGKQYPPNVHIADTFYQRILAHGPDEPSVTRISQLALLLGGLSFFLYVLDWLLLQKGEEELRAAVFDPIADFSHKLTHKHG